MEQCDRLAKTGWKLYYDDELFPPGTDSFLLSSFPIFRPGLRVCDLGCGSGLLGLLALRREPTLDVTGLEVEKSALTLAARNATENGLANHLHFCHCDLRNGSELPKSGSFDLALCNPPYFPADSGALASQPSRQATRAEITCTLEDIARAAARLVRWGGALCLVHRPERLTDICCTLRKAGLEPKRLRLVQQTAGGAPTLLLMEARRGGHPGLAIHPPLVLHEADGRPTAELDTIYYRDTEDTP